LYNFAADSQKNNLPSLYPEKLNEMDAVVQSEHQHPYVLDWEVVDSKVKKRELEITDRKFLQNNFRGGCACQF
jgi:hypothetical protein